MDNSTLTVSQKEWLESRKELKLTKSHIEACMESTESIIRSNESMLLPQGDMPESERAAILNSLELHKETLRIFKELKPIDEPTEVILNEVE